VTVQQIDTAAAPVGALDIRYGNRWNWSWSWTWGLSVSILSVENLVFVKCVKLLNIIRCLRVLEHGLHVTGYRVEWLLVTGSLVCQ